MAQAKVNIPYPHTSIENPIAYNWGNDDNWAGQFWERRRQAVISKLTGSKVNYDDNLQDLRTLGERMKALGEAERQKELNLLRRALPDFDFSNVDENQLIQKLNEVIRGKEQFEFALQRIEAAMNHGGTMAKTTKESFKGLAPSMASVFLSYLTTEMVATFNQFAQQLNINDSISQWDVYLEQHFNEAVDIAMRKMLEESRIGQDVDKIYGDADQWRAIGETYRMLKPFQDQFKSMLRSKLNLDELKAAFTNGENSAILNKAQRGIRYNGFSTYLRKNLKWDKRTASIGGSVAEFLNTLIANMVPKGGTITDKATVVVEGEKVRTDTIGVYQFTVEGQFDAAGLANDLNSVLTSAGGLSDAAEGLRNFYNRNLRNLNDTFIIYTSTKNYSLGSGFSGFHNGSNLPLRRLPEYIDAAGISADVGQDFVYTAYNTLESAIFEDEREDIRQNIVNILTSAAAKLMFDDWQTIGVPNVGAQSIHVFDLDGISIPASLLFIRLGTAMMTAVSEMKTWVSVRVHLPHTVLYHPGDWRTFGSTNEEIKQGIYQKWEEQAKLAEKESEFSVKFLYNFKGLMNKLIQGIPI